jgi:hypothetical protein
LPNAGASTDLFSGSFFLDERELTYEAKLSVLSFELFNKPEVLK